MGEHRQEIEEEMKDAGEREDPDREDVASYPRRSNQQ